MNECIWLTREQVEEIYRTSEEFQLGVEIEATNIQDVVLLKFRTDSSRTQLEQVLLGGDGSTMKLS